MTDSASLTAGSLDATFEMGDIARFSIKGLRLKPEATPEDVAQMVDRLLLMHQGIQFWVGDAVNQSEDKDGDRIWQYVTQATVLNWCSTARRIPEEERFLQLPYAHHRAVSSLERHERREILSKAVAEEWSCRRVEHEAKKLRKVHPSSASDPDTASESFTGEAEVELVSKKCPTCGGRGIVEERVA